MATADYHKKTQKSNSGMLMNSKDKQMDLTGIEDPDKINKDELLHYYGHSGFIGELKLGMRYITGWILQSLAKFSPHPKMAVVFQRLRGVKIGKHVYIGPEVNIDDLYPHLVVIEDYVSIGMRSMLFVHSNPTCSIELKKRHYPRKTAPVTIKKGAWVAPGCIILAGVTIGENSVVGAGSVVIRDVESYTVVAGNPAKPIKTLEH